jgi:ArsR family transcriptional regulator, arsenate/arsenite/antimonite-responsive transcriptional repressor
MNVAQTLAALSDDTRRRILSLLAERGSLAAGAVAEAFALSKPTISHHLRVLEEASLVRSERRGTSIVYTLQSNVLEDAAAAVLALAAPTKRAASSHRPPPTTRKKVPS